jgi:hypothetical protein
MAYERPGEFGGVIDSGVSQDKLKRRANVEVCRILGESTHPLAFLHLADAQLSVLY